MKKYNFFILTLLFLTCTQLFSYSKIKCFTLSAPEHFLQGVSRVAVLDFYGNYNVGRYLSDQIISEMLQKDRGIHQVSAGFLKTAEGRTYLEGATTRVFDIVERSTLESVLDEQLLGESGIVDEQQAASFGKVLGVDAIIIGDYDVSTDTKQTYEEWTYTENKKKYTKTVECLTRTTSVTVSARVVGVETAQILSTYSDTKKIENKECDDRLAKLASVDEQIRTCMVAHANAFTSSINPVFTELSIELEKIKTKEFKDKADKAAKLVETCNLDEAYLLYYSIYEQDAYNPKVLFNLGALNEVVGNYENAAEFYETALQLESASATQKAIARVKNSQILKDNLALIGINLLPHTFEMSRQAIAEAQAKKVHIKGKREERFAIKTEPSEASSDVTKVPGDISVKVLKREQGWYLVELPGNKQGYIQESLVELE